jgi:hypothetical protein
VRDTPPDGAEEPDVAEEPYVGAEPVGDAVRGGRRVANESSTHASLAAGVITAAPGAASGASDGHDPAGSITAAPGAASSSSSAPDATGTAYCARPVPRTGRNYAAPAGHPLHVALVDFTPYPPPDAWRHRTTECPPVSDGSPDGDAEPLRDAGSLRDA